MVRYVKNEGRPALGFAVESEESDESSDDEPLSDQPSLATLGYLTTKKSAHGGFA